MTYQTKIQALNKKIQEYKTKYPKRSWEQTSYLNCLWLELAFWELAEAGEITISPLYFKAEKSWEHLKEIYRQKGSWPQRKLVLFLSKQKPEYTEMLIGIIEQEEKEEYLKLAQWLRKKFDKSS